MQAEAVSLTQILESMTSSQWFGLIISPLVSMIVSALIAYLFGVRAGRITLRQNLEVKTGDALIDLINTSLIRLTHVEDAARSVDDNFTAYYDWYNKDERNASTFRPFKPIGNNFDAFSLECADYFSSASSTTHFAENRAIILNCGFKTFIDKIHELNRNLSRGRTLLRVYLLASSTFNLVEREEEIPQSDYASIKQQLSAIKTLLGQLSCLYTDFSRELQNEFIGKLYENEQNVEMRNPPDPIYATTRKDPDNKW